MKPNRKKKIEVHQIGPKTWGVFEDNQEKSRFRTEREAQQWMAKYRKK